MFNFCNTAVSSASFSSFWLPLIVAVLLAVLVESAVVIAFLKHKEKKTSQTVLNADEADSLDEESALQEAISSDLQETTEELVDEPTEATTEQSTEELADEPTEATTEQSTEELEDEPTEETVEADDDDKLPNRAVLDEDELEDAKELEKIIHPDESLDEFSQNTDTDETAVSDETATETLPESSDEAFASFIADETPDSVAEDDQSYVSVLSGGAKLIDDEGAFGGKLFFGGKEIAVRYLRSFTAKLSQSNDLVKERYSALKNELLSYKKAKARISWYAESFRLGKPTVAKITVRGKTLTLYLALSPDKLQGTKYHYKDVGSVKKYAQVPTCLKIKSNRAVRWAKELISLMAEENGFTRFDAPEIDYYPEYRTTEELVMSNLIKLQGVNALNEYEKLQRADDFNTSFDDYIENESTLEAPVTDDSQPLQAVETVAAAEIHDGAPMAIIMECTLTEDGAANEPAEEPIEVKETKEPEEPEEQPVPDVEPEIEEVYEPLAERDFQIVHEVSVTRADKDMTNEKAVSLIEEVEVIKQKADKQGAKGIINIDTLSQNYKAGETVTLDDLKRKKLLPKKIGYLKVLGRGIINKPLIVEADEFSINAAKMILLTGGRVVRDL